MTCRQPCNTARRTYTRVVWVVLASVTAGCASTTPTGDLERAHDTYARAAEGPAADAPDARASLSAAKRAIEHARRARASELPDSETAHLAYIAKRRAQIAEQRVQQLAFDVRREQLDYRVQAKTTPPKVDAEPRPGTRPMAELEHDPPQPENTPAPLSDDTTARIEEVAIVQKRPEGQAILMPAELLFSADSTQLRDDARASLATIADILATDLPETVLRVEGHTDSRGSSEYNQTLGRKRAEAVETFLVQQGIDPLRLSAEGIGELQPIGNNRTAEGRAANRRVEIVVSNPDRAPVAAHTQSP